MPSLDEDETYDADNVAALLGVHLVGQVLDEACTIANAAQRIGWPWTCVLSIYKDIKSGKLAVPGQDDLFEVAQGDNEIVIKNKEFVPSVTSSTPHKDDMIMLKLDNSLIGQGDEEFDMQQDELGKSTSMFINNLFDMSEVVPDILSDDEVEPNDTSNGEELTQMVAKIMEMMFFTVFKNSTETEVIEPVEQEIQRSPEESCSSFLGDDYDEVTGQEIAYFIKNDIFLNNDNKELESWDTPEQTDNEENTMEDRDVTHFENTYLTLNRDYEQCSDEESEQILQDPKGLVMQDVELLTASTSDDNLSSPREPEQEARKELAAVSAVSGASGSRKSHSSLVSRCKSQGARLLSCLRGWWRRKTPGKRRASRGPGSILGVCPISPDARRRAASLLDQRHLYSPATARSVGWKFNTVNETVVNSSRWKEYTFDKPGDCEKL